VCLFCCLFNHVFSDSNYIASNEGVISGFLSWKGCGSKRPWPNFKVISRHLSGGTEENHKTLSQNGRSPGRDLKPEPPE
jgi:hypothetical protein